MSLTKTQSIDFRRGILAVRDALLIHGRDGMNELFRVAEQELKAAGAAHEPAEQLYTVYEADLHEMLPGEPWPALSDNWTVVRAAKKSGGGHSNLCACPACLQARGREAIDNAVKANEGQS